MDSDAIIREQLMALLTGSNAHMTYADAVADFPLTEINTVFPQGTYTPWQLLEHIRITQWDILDFIANPDYQELKWPDEYWPTKKKAGKKDWLHTIATYEYDRDALVKLVKKTDTDLYAKIPHGNGQTIFQEVLLVVDHTAYHVGEFAIMRQVMNTWGPNHE